ncbi:MAG: dockerin type I repeat-containing protein, partial [Candidatus Zixiibacteriota bacterium]
PYGGTWSFLGSGFGTTLFDISSLPTDTVRYLKIVDDNDGSSTEWYPGCDIDAVTHLRPIFGPSLTLYTYRVDDDNAGQSSGNNDGDVDFGETIELGLVLENIGDSTAYAVEVTLRTIHAEVTVIDSQTTFGDIPAGDTASGVAYLVFLVTTNVSDGETISFELEIDAANGSWGYDGPDLAVHAPVLVYFSKDIDDFAGNGNGKADPGETCDLSITLKNEGGHDAVQVGADLLSYDPYVTVTSGTSSYPDLPPEDTGASLTPYQITIEEECPVGHFASLILEMNAQGPYVTADTFRLVVGQIPILLVDDDGGESYETYFLAAFDSVGFGYDIWTHQTQGSPPDSVLRLYEAVVWSTGDDYGTISEPKTLTATDQAGLMTYLDNGGSLFLSSQDFLLDNNPSTFITDYLHVAGHSDDQTVGLVSGVSGDTVSDGMSFDLSYPFFNFSDHIVPAAGAAGIFYEIGKGSSVLREEVQIDGNPGEETANPVDYCALRYPDSGPSVYKVIFLAFSFEAVPQAGTDPNNSYVLMERILDWFNVGGEILPYIPGDANGDQIVNVGDVVYLVSYLYKNGPAPDPLAAGDADCNGVINVSDVVYLVNYLYKGGPAPCQDGD